MHGSENHIRRAGALIALGLWAAPVHGAAPRFADAAGYDAGPSAVSVAIRDVDGDGALDIVVDADGAARWLRNDGSGRFTAAAVVEGGLDPVPDVPADLDGDGSADLVDLDVRRDAVTVFYGSRAAPFRRRTYPLGADPWDAVAADLDGDGRADLAVAGGPGTIYVLVNAGNRMFADPQRLPVPGRTLAVAAGDLDADGQVDLAALGADGSTVWVLLNRTSQAGDLNGDDLVDVEDLLDLLGVWGQCPSCDQDLTGDGDVDVEDLIEMMGRWSVDG